AEPPPAQSSTAFRVLRAICGLAIGAWVLFLTYSFAAAAHQTAVGAALIGHGQINGALAFSLGAPGVIASLGLIAHFGGKNENAFRMLSVLTFLIAAVVVLFLTIASHSVHGGAAFCLLMAWSWLT